MSETKTPVAPEVVEAVEQTIIKGKLDEVSAELDKTNAQLNQGQEQIKEIQQQLGLMAQRSIMLVGRKSMLEELLEPPKTDDTSPKPYNGKAMDGVLN